MAKLTAWLVTLIGVVLLLPNFMEMPPWIMSWIVPLAVLVIGIGKLVRNYKLFKK